ncbi:hypothetical protein AVEN_32497-1, partial [Araneus ventricosus]
TKSVLTRVTFALVSTNIKQGIPQIDPSKYSPFLPPQSAETFSPYSATLLRKDILRPVRRPYISFPGWVKSSGILSVRAPICYTSSKSRSDFVDE